MRKRSWIPDRVPGCRASGLGLASLLALACASLGAPPAPLKPAPHLPLGPPLQPRTVSRPQGRARPPALRLLETTRFSLHLQDSDLRALLLGLGRDSPLNVVVDPRVKGQVTAQLEDVSLLQILDEVVVRRGYRYSVRGNLLHIYEPRPETRIYQIDYPSYRRKGSSQVDLAGFLGAAPSVGGEGESEQEDASSTELQTTQDTNLWAELEAGLRAIVFGSSGEGEPEEGDSQEEGEGGAAVRRLHVSPAPGIVTVTAEPDVLEDVEAYLQEVARTTQRQVLIDAQILEVDLGDELQLGVDWEIAANNGVFSRQLLPGDKLANIASRLAPTLTQGGLSIGLATNELGARLDALARETDVRVVSTPRVAVLNNHQAVIKVVRNDVFFVGEVNNVIQQQVVQQTVEFNPQIVQVGVTLDVTPQISSEQEVTLHIHPSVSDIVDVKQQPTTDPNLPDTGSLPVVDIRETDTVLRVPDETTVVLGGLVQSREFKQEKKVPLLGDIPYLGMLFRQSQVEERRTELVILLTPKILDPPRIARITSAARSEFEEVDALRLERRKEPPWWRRPYRRSYGVQ